MKTKDQVFSHFQEFMALVENMTAKRIKVLHMDNGGKYTNKYFTYFCAKGSIRRNQTTLYNPQYNGVGEQKKRTILGVAKAMVYDQDMPKFLWEKTCSTVLYIQNRVPHMALRKIHQRMSSLGRNQRSSTSRSSVDQHIVMCQMINAPNQTSLQRSDISLVIVKYPRQ